MYNADDEDLTELGIKQAKEFGKRIKDMNFDLIISSPLVRAKHTALIININHNQIIFVNMPLKFCINSTLFSL